MDRRNDTEATIAAGRAILLPTVAFDDDLAAAFRLSRATARRKMAEGAFGPRFRMGRRWAVLKESLLAHLSRSATLPSTVARLHRLHQGEET